MDLLFKRKFPLRHLTELNLNLMFKKKKDAMSWEVNFSAQKMYTC